MQVEDEYELVCSARSIRPHRGSSLETFSVSIRFSHQTVRAVSA
eukprot:SAG22_NODE_18722_length_282_cov_1.005464_2_plen_43_part_01